MTLNDLYNNLTCITKARDQLTDIINQIEETDFYPDEELPDDYALDAGQVILELQEDID